MSLEPLRVPITAMVRSTLRDEREVLEPLGRTSIPSSSTCGNGGGSEARDADRPDGLYRRAAEEWESRGRQATALQVSSANLVAAHKACRQPSLLPAPRFGRRAMLAAWLVALTGLGLIGGLCGVVWLALTHR